MEKKQNKFKEYIRKIQFSNGTYYVTLPMKYIKSLGWKEQQGVLAKLSGKANIVISKFKRKK